MFTLLLGKQMESAKESEGEQPFVTTYAIWEVPLTSRALGISHSANGFLFPHDPLSRPPTFGSEAYLEKVYHC